MDDDFNEYNEINASIQINKLITNNIAHSFPTFMEWTTLNSPIFSNTWIALFYQHVGHSFTDIYTLNKEARIEPCHLFELMYALYALHMRCELCHNNITTDNIMYQIIDNNNVNVYILSDYGEKDTYVFNNNIKLYLTDFSESISFQNASSINKVIKEEYNKYFNDDQFITSNQTILFYLICINDYKQLCKCFYKLQPDMKELLDKLLVLLNDMIMMFITEKNIDYIEQINNIFSQLFNEYLFDSNDTEFAIGNINYIMN